MICPQQYFAETRRSLGKERTPSLVYPCNSEKGMMQVWRVGPPHAEPA